MSSSSLTSAEIIAAAVAKTGLARLAQVSGVPYTTLTTFRKRGWKAKSWTTAERVVAAAQLILAEDEASETARGSTEP